jgi:hypothetical protein
MDKKFGEPINIKIQKNQSISISLLKGKKSFESFYFKLLLLV